MRRTGGLIQWVKKHRRWFLAALTAAVLVELSVFWGIILGITGGHPGRYRLIEVVIRLNAFFDHL